MSIVNRKLIIRQQKYSGDSREMLLFLVPDICIGSLDAAGIETLKSAFFICDLLSENPLLLMLYEHICSHIFIRDSFALSLLTGFVRPVTMPILNLDSNFQLNLVIRRF